MSGQDEREGLVGYRFPGGAFRIEPYEHWLVCDTFLVAPPANGIAHPMYCYYAALGGMGISLEELFDLAGVTADSGVMFGEASIELRTPLRVGTTYQVRGGITDLVRKEGRRTGVFDILTFELEISTDGGLAGKSSNSFVFPSR